MKFDLNKLYATLCELKCKVTFFEIQLSMFPQVKVWNSLSGFCFVTFPEHCGEITGVKVTQNGKSVLSSSLDGTVRAFDLTRFDTY